MERGDSKLQEKTTYLRVEPQDIENIFNDFDCKNPFSFKKEYKEYRKNYSEKTDKEFEALLALELQSAYKNAKPSNYIYHNKKQHKISLIKLRIKDAKANSGKSGGWRVIALVDELNNIFYLLSLYKHSKGKDDLTPQENKKARELCDEYFDSINQTGGSNYGKN